MQPLHDSYDDYARQVQRLLYVGSKALKTLLRTVGESQPAALKATPEQFIDHSTLQKVERSEFVEGLYGG